MNKSAIMDTFVLLGSIRTVVPYSNKNEVPLFFSAYHYTPFPLVVRPTTVEALLTHTTTSYCTTVCTTHQAMPQKYPFGYGARMTENDKEKAAYSTALCSVCKCLPKTVTVNTVNRDKHNEWYTSWRQKALTLFIAMPTYCTTIVQLHPPENTVSTT